ncbi:protein ATP6V1FNB isoform X1 [Prionailurus iriomotensis]
MRDLCTTQNQACWQECIRKEAAARVAWKIHYGHKYLKGGPTPRKRVQRAPFGSALAATSSTESKEVQVGWPESKGVRDQLSGGGGVRGPSPKGNKVWEAQRATQGPSVQPKPEGLEMRQVPPSTLQLFFQGLSHDGQGRALYLRERHRQKPEEKFLYPILSSWEYGWHVEQDLQPVGIWGASAALARTLGVLTLKCWDGWAKGRNVMRGDTDAMKDTRAPTYARRQPITKTFYIKSGVFHFPRRTDQLM